MHFQYLRYNNSLMPLRSLTPIKVHPLRFVPFDDDVYLQQKGLLYSLLYGINIWRIQLHILQTGNPFLGNQFLRLQDKKQSVNK